MEENIDVKDREMESENGVAADCGNGKDSRKKPGFKDSLKSMDTEETFDLIFYRPIGYGWALLAKKLGITPNAITIASIFLGVGAGVEIGRAHV